MTLISKLVSHLKCISRSSKFKCVARFSLIARVAGQFLGKLRATIATLSRNELDSGCCDGFGIIGENQCELRGIEKG